MGTCLVLRVSPNSCFKNAMFLSKLILGGKSPMYTSSSCDFFRSTKDKETNMCKTWTPQKLAGSSREINDFAWNFLGKPSLKNFAFSRSRMVNFKFYVRIWANPTCLLLSHLKLGENRNKKKQKKYVRDKESNRKEQRKYFKGIKLYHI